MVTSVYMHVYTYQHKARVDRGTTHTPSDYRYSYRYRTTGKVTATGTAIDTTTGTGTGTTTGTTTGTVTATVQDRYMYLSSLHLYMNACTVHTVHVQ